MTKVLNSEWTDRLEHWICVLKKDFYQPLGEISWSAYRTMKQISPEAVMKETFMPVEPGYTWGNTWEYCWFKGQIVLPDSARGKRIVMDLKPEGESTLFVNGEAFGTYRASWVSCLHHFFEDNVLTREARGGEIFEILMETYAGHYFPCEPNTAETGPILPEQSYTDELEEGKRRTLGHCTYGIFQEEAYQLYMDVDALYKLYKVLEPGSLRRVHIAKALKRFTMTVDFEQEREKRIEAYKSAREELRPVLEAHNGSTVPAIYAVGNAHIDLAWLWPLEETRRKTARTFAAQLRLMEEYPEYKYIQSQPAAYEMCREEYPELFERIKEAIKKGQWIADGAMWAEPDTNITGGEALIRQILYGKKYFKEVFGVDSEILWLPDSFGYSAALPQILKGCGIKHLVTQKIFCSYNNEERFPYHYFKWEGIDGSQIVSFLPTSYLYQTHPEEVVNVWKNRVQEDMEGFLLPYGYGDGGGGPARDYLEYAKRMKDLEGCPEVKLASPEEFFDDMEKRAGEPDETYTGELYFCAHRGTYTTQAKVKKNNRNCELALREMEFWISLAAMKGMEYSLKEMEDLWRVLLLNQFHDILPGSSIAKVYEEAEKQVGEAIAGADKLKEKAVRYLMSTNSEEASSGEQWETPVTILNSLSFEREEVVTLPEKFANGARDEKGQRISVQKEESGVRALVKLPSCGGITLYPEVDGTLVQERTSFVKKEQNYYRMENDKVSVLLNGRGEIISYVRKESGREFAAAPMNALHLYKDIPRHFDAWDLDSVYRELETDEAKVQQVETLAQGIEAVVKITGKIGNSEYIQVLRLATGSQLLEVEMKIDWKELHRLLKVSFPTTVYAQNGINEIQFGYVERPAHRSRQYDKDRFEVCNHRYSAMYDNGSGFALFNDCKYGISMEEGCLSLTLLRAAASPAMRTDNGLQSFRYGFYPWEGNKMEHGIAARAYGFNVKPQIQKGRLDIGSVLFCDKKNILLDTMKLAEDGSSDMILRFYEAENAATAAVIQGPVLEGEKIYLCNMLENTQQEISEKAGEIRLNFTPFEIKTIRVHK